MKRIVADMGKFLGQRRWLKDEEVAVIKVTIGLKQGPDHPLARIIAWYVGAALRIYGHRALQPGGHGRAAGCYEICSSDILRESGFDLSKAEELAREGTLNSKKGLGKSHGWCAEPSTRPCTRKCAPASRGRRSDTVASNGKTGLMLYRQLGYR